MCCLAEVFLSGGGNPHALLRTKGQTDALHTIQAFCAEGVARTVRTPCTVFACPFIWVLPFATLQAFVGKHAISHMATLIYTIRGVNFSLAMSMSSLRVVHNVLPRSKVHRAAAKMHCNPHQWQSPPQGSGK